MRWALLEPFSLPETDCFAVVCGTFQLKTTFHLLPLINLDVIPTCRIVVAPSDPCCITFYCRSYVEGVLCRERE